MILLKRTLSRLIIPAETSNLTIEMGTLLFLLHAAVTTLKMSGGAIASELWSLKVYDVIMARLVFVAVEIKRFWCPTMQSYQKLSRPRKLCLFCALCKNIFVPVWMFLSTSLEKEVSELFEPRLWVLVCQRMSTCVPTHEYLCANAWVLVCQRMSTCVATHEYLCANGWVFVCQRMSG